MANAAASDSASAVSTKNTTSVSPPAGTGTVQGPYVKPESGTSADLASEDDRRMDLREDQHEANENEKDN